jgi:hypothetical protein
MKRALRLLCLLPLATLAACSAPPRPVSGIIIPAGKYTQAFDAARDAVRELRFDLERVDARQGVLTTRAKATNGLATPWDVEQSTTEQELEDLVNQQSRKVRVVFTARAAQPSGAAASDDLGDLPPLQDAPLPQDLLSHPGTVTMRVVVTRSRTQRPGWRLSTNSVRSSSFSIDPARGETPEDAEYESSAGEDRDLATRVLESVRVALDLPKPRTSTTTRRRPAPVDPSKVPPAMP